MAGSCETRLGVGARDTFPRCPTCSGLRRSCTHWYSMLVIWWSRQLLLNSRLW